MTISEGVAGTSKEAPMLTLSRLQEACRSGAAFRRIARLQPAGGVGDKVYPPTYEGGQYAKETRLVDGQRVECVSLDSVQSQANRIEQCLLDAHRDGDIKIPVIAVDFSKVLPEVGVITSLDAPHRMADAILRDSTLGGKKFRESEVGKLLDSARVSNATGLFRVCPTALVFGLWDSAGPKGGLGTKFARALVSEIVAIDVAMGARATSRIDPLGIELKAGKLYETSEGDWTLDENAAIKADKKPKLFKEGKPSSANHGNITPSLTDDATKKPHHGGVTFRYALQTSVLSLPALRRMRFPAEGAAPTRERDHAAHVVLAALALYGLTASAERGIDLRSRCALVPEAGTPPRLELVASDGTATQFALTAAAAATLLSEALGVARTQGLGWDDGGYQLEPRANLVDLVRRSRDASLKSQAEG